MSTTARAIFVRYGLPVLSVGVAHALTHLLWLVSEGNLSLLFITAVMISALYGGLRSGLIAAGLAAAASAYFYLSPRYSFDIDFADLVRLAAFVFVAVFVAWLNGSRRQSEQALREAHDALEQRVRERTAALSAANDDLLAYQRRLKSLAAELSDSEERQRRETAAALHDGIGHRLAVAVMKLRGLLQGDGDAGRGVTAADANGPAAAREIERACQLVEESIEHTRTLTVQLSPPILYELGLAPAIDWLAEEVQRQTGLSVAVDDDDLPKPADEHVRTLLFNATRELLVNAVKHARAGAAKVTLRRENDTIRLTVSDDGVGCDGALLHNGQPPKRGFGLFNIRERLTHLGGRLEVDSAPGRGCRVTLTAPAAAAPPPPHTAAS